MIEVPFDDLNAGDRVRVVLRAGLTVEGQFEGFGAAQRLRVLKLVREVDLPGCSKRSTLLVQTRKIERVLRLGR